MTSTYPSVRTRFAPSPTGALHLGNVRVAVFNWLLARHHGGSFALRMEDTDLERNLPGAEDAIMEDLRWLGLDWDEGPDVGGPGEPYRQSQGMERYRDAARALLTSGAAYRAFDLPGDELEEGSGRRPYRELPREEQERRASAGVVPVIRLRMPDEVVEIHDEIRGAIRFEGKDMGDFILLRSDGRPTYNFAVVVDDARQGVTHVIRGAGHLSNTPKQALLFDALGAPRPRFIHLPTVLGTDRKKLSKREGAAAVAELREAGYPPGGIVNYLSLLGWSSPDGEEILSVAELVERISVERLGAADTVYDPEKLRWVCARHLAGLSDSELARRAAPFVDRGRFPELEGERLVAAISGVRSHLSHLGEVNRWLEGVDPGEEVLRGVRDALDPEMRRVVGAVATALVRVAEEGWREEEVMAAIRAVGKALGVRGPGLFHPVRLGLTGATSGPELGKVLMALGPREVLRRLRTAADIGVV